MIYAGKQITSSSDLLAKINIDYLYNSLRNPKPNIVSQINLLHTVKNIDAKQYSNLKRQLPYIVCAAFNPAFRRTENFAYTEYFIVDLDHLSEKDIDIISARKRIEADERVLLSFISPSKDGLKIMFRLSERCYDAGIYSVFYKKFVHQFAIDMGLEQVVDARTCDVCRACFVSIDANAYYNPNAITINLDSYINQDNSKDLFDIKRTITKDTKEIIKAENADSAKSKTIDPDNDTMLRIKQILTPNSKTPPPQSNIFIPEQINEILTDLKIFIEDTGVQIYETVGIQYGKKLRFKLGVKLSEINLFYGKRGFSIVISPRSGTNEELNKTMHALIMHYIIQNT